MRNQEKHSFLYFLGRGLPGLINFISLSVYTHLLSPSQYGDYALVITSVTLFSSLLFLWIKLSLLRFLESDVVSKTNLTVLANLSVGYVLSMAVSIIVVCPLFYYKGSFSTSLILYGLAILFLDSLLELCLEFYRSNLRPMRYALIFTTKSLLYCLVGVSFAYFGFGTSGILVSMVMTLVLVILIFCTPLLLLFIKSTRFFDRKSFKDFFIYGAPFTITFSMGFIFNSSDRYFVTYYLGDDANGIYSAGYDLARQSIWVIFSAVSLATYPIVLKTLQREGRECAQRELNRSLILLMFVGIPISVMLIGASYEISTLFLGADFAPVVQSIIPWIVFGTLILGIKNFYFDVFFQLEKKTGLQIIPVSLAAILNIILNYFFIPVYGVMGAVYSTLISFLLAVFISALMSAKYMLYKFPILKLFKLTVAGAVCLFFIMFCKQFFQPAFVIFLLCPMSSLVFVFSAKLLYVEEADYLINKLLNFAKKKRQLDVE